jgi:hypothetical protein
MNRTRIIVGGLVAGIFILGTNALAAEYIVRHVANAPVNPEPNSIDLMRSLCLGVISVLLYGIIARSRGQGNETALTTGLFVFLVSVLFPPFSAALNGAMPARVFLMYIVWNAGGIPLATLAGAQFYREQRAPVQSPA